MDIILHALFEGIIYSIILGLIITISQLFNARLWVDDYPEEIQKRVPKRTKKENIAKLIMGIPFILVMFGYPIYSTFMLKDSMGVNYTFWNGFLNTFIITSMFNLFDLLILDWLIFCYINPKFLTLKGTEGMKEYKDYYFHVRGATKGFIMSIVFSVIIAMIFII